MSTTTQILALGAHSFVAKVLIGGAAIFLMIVAIIIMVAATTKARKARLGKWK